MGRNFDNIGRTTWEAGSEMWKFGANRTLFVEPWEFVQHELYLNDVWIFIYCLTVTILHLHYAKQLSALQVYNQYLF
jgi:hypothetical protein